ncbi:MAG: hypothetical protein H0T89_19880 [Deltaproteobacteria bacterium]|nr:hypothetical protein [Deltaproteobacteria bacterium]MDQ3298283.1 hypothetical protein [Myxococcota bacterium]
MIRCHVIGTALVLACSLASSQAFADGPSKEVCLDSHSRGQDARDAGKLSLARKLFLACAQSACPSLVQGDCARYTDDLARMQPTVSFLARDGSGADLPDTTIYVDEMLLATRLDDGKTYDLDPGKHTIRFVHHGKEQTVTVVVGSGEKGRTVAATFASPPARHAVTATELRTSRGSRDDGMPATPARSRASRPTGAKVLLVVGAIGAIGGGALGIVGLTRVPASCSLGSNECAAPPGDPAFDDARSAVQLTNIGFLSGGIGVVAIIGGLVWYFQGSKQATESDEHAVAPWLVPGGGGIAFRGRL